MAGKYYLVSEGELIDLVFAAYDVANAHPGNPSENKEMLALEDKAYASCLTRPVPEDTQQVVFVRPGEIKQYDTQEWDRYGYMDLTDFDCELGEGPTCQIYSSVEQLKKAAPCVHQCGIVKVKVVSVEVIQAPNYGAEDVDPQAGE